MDHPVHPGSLFRLFGRLFGHRRREVVEPLAAAVRRTHPEEEDAAGEDEGCEDPDDDPEPRTTRAFRRRTEARHRPVFVGRFPVPEFPLITRAGGRWGELGRDLRRRASRWLVGLLRQGFWFWRRLRRHCGSLLCFFWRARCQQPGTAIGAEAVIILILVAAIRTGSHRSHITFLLGPIHHPALVLREPRPRHDRDRNSGTKTTCELTRSDAGREHHAGHCRAG